MLAYCSLLGATLVLGVAAGTSHSCALLNDYSGTGVVRCWGVDGTYGAYSGSTPGLADVQWAYATSGNSGIPPFIQLSGEVLTGAIAISAGYDMTCAVLGAPDYAVVCTCAAFHYTAQLLMLPLYAVRI